jgi:hypothetical protein
MFEGFDDESPQWIVLDRHGYLVGSGLQQAQAESWARSIGGSAKPDASGVSASTAAQPLEGSDAA